MGKMKKTKAPAKGKKIVKKSSPSSPKPVKKALTSTTSKEPSPKKTPTPKSKKILTAEGWKRLMMGAKKS